MSTVAARNSTRCARSDDEPAGFPSRSSRGSSDVTWKSERTCKTNGGIAEGGQEAERPRAEGGEKPRCGEGGLSADRRKVALAVASGGELTSSFSRERSNLCSNERVSNLRNETLAISLSASRAIWDLEYARFHLGLAPGPRPVLLEARFEALATLDTSTTYLTSQEGVVRRGSEPDLQGKCAV